MKKLVLFASMMILSICGYSQYYMLSSPNAGENPGDLNQEDTEFPVGGGIAAGWTTILGVSQASPTFSPVQNLPIDFMFNGDTVTQYKVSSSGVLTFSLAATPAPASTSVALPNASVPDSSICILGINGTGSSDNIVSKTFGTAPNRQHWIHFSSYSATGTGWTYWSIVLEETSNSIYFVDQRTNGTVALSVGIQLDATTAFSVPGSPSLGSFSTNAADRTDNSFYEFVFGIQPQYNVKNIQISNIAYLEVGSSASISGVVRNFGSETVTSLDVQYTVDGGSPVSATLTGLNIPTNTSYSYVHSAPWTPSPTQQFQTYSIATLVTLVNGNVDEDMSNNSASKSIEVHPTSVPRVPLLEAFTSSTCGPCTPGNINVAEVLTAFPNQYSKVNYQMSWPGTGDPYFTNEGAERRSFYGVNSVPTIFTDGLNGKTSTLYEAIDFTSAEEKPAFIEMSTDATIRKEVEYSVVDDKLIREVSWVLNAKSWYSPTIDIPTNLIAQHAINEKLTFLNVKSNGETQFEHVMKKMMPTPSGVSVSATTANATDTLTNSHAFVGDYRLSNNAEDPIDHATENSIEEFSDLEIVFWIQTPGTRVIWQSYHEDVTVLDSITNLTVVDQGGQMIYVIGTDSFQTYGANGDFAPLGSGEIVGTEFSVFPNPARDVITIAGTEGIVNVTIYDMQGRQVTSVSTQNNMINLSDLNAGMYMMAIENKGKLVTTKISVVK